MNVCAFEFSVMRLGLPVALFLVTRMVVLFHFPSLSRLAAAVLISLAGTLVVAYVVGILLCSTGLVPDRKKHPDLYRLESLIISCCASVILGIVLGEVGVSGVQ